MRAFHLTLLPVERDLANLPSLTYSHIMKVATDVMPEMAVEAVFLIILLLLSKVCY